MATETEKSKALMFKVIMRNPKLSKIVREAFSAPIGSSKREQAKSIVSILKRVSESKFDGSGGPGSGSVGPSMQQVVPNFGTSGNVMIFPAAPKMRVRINGSNNNGFRPQGQGGQGQGGSGSLTDMYSNMLGSDLTSNPLGGNDSSISSNFSNLSNLSNGVANASTSTANSDLGDWMNKYNSVINPPKLPTTDWGGLAQGISNFFTPTKLTLPPKPNPFNINAPFSTPTPLMPTDQTTPTDTNTDSGIAPVIPPTIPDYRTSHINTDPQAPASDNTAGTNTNPITPANNPAPAATPTGNGSTSGISNTGFSLPSQTPDSNTGTKTPSFDMGSVNNYSNYTNNPTLANMVQNNLGAGSFALKVMGDPKLMAEFGFDPSQVIPGASLSQQVGDLDTTLRKYYQVDDLRNRLGNSEAQGPALQSNITNYIRGKDEVVGTIDGLIDKTKNSMYSMDMANPSVSSDVNNYLNFLYTLKGKQNGRYIDMLNGAIAQHQSDVTNLQNDYNNAVSDYQNAFKIGSTIDQDNYNRLYTTLSDTYNQLEGAPEKALTREFYATQLQNAQLQSLIDAKTASGTNSEYVSQEAKYQDKIIDNEAMSNGVTNKNKGNLQPGANLTAWVSNLTNQGYDPRGVVDLFSQAMNRKLSSESGLAAINTAREYQKQIAEYAQNGGGTSAYDLGSMVISKASTGIQKYVTDNIDAVKNAVSNLVPHSTFWGGKKGMPDKTNWINTYKGSLDPTLLGEIYDYVKLNLDHDPTIDPNILLTGSANLLIGKAQPTDIANTIASGVTEPWKFEIAYPASGETANLTYSPQDTTQPTNTGTQTSQ